MEADNQEENHELKSTKRSLQEINRSCEKAVSSGDKSSLKVKIKMPKLKEEVVVVEEEEKEINGIQEEIILKKKDHICSECGKQFSSGKALGGHMSSAHVQANNREESWKNKQLKVNNYGQSSKRSRILVEEEDGVKKITCDLCGKNFPSKKSLFGHMRCHPDRDWRGMKPPNNKDNFKNKGVLVFPANNSLDYDDDDDNDDYFLNTQEYKELHEIESASNINININVAPAFPKVDLKDCLKSWAVKDKRGRSAKLSSISNSDDKELQDAVHQLIRLVNGVNNINSPKNRHTKTEELEVMCSNSVTPDLPLKDKAKGKRKADDIEDDYCSGIESKDCFVMANKKRSMPDQKQQQQTQCNSTSGVCGRPDEKQQIKNVTPGKKMCSICGKTFTSHQALGGHRSSHNKFKMTIENTIDQEIIKSDTAKQDDGSEINIGNASKVLDFDLNELPDVDDCYR
ncbi:uncharacterized protein LOC107831697 [Nicotiana tabacum]|uniref:Uncharacterized protein LOC107831697 n=1 Tax=Nicotiana tabacum TaxID=4097 RepID=A0A1S4DNJ4_TOBAC|nr:uncharacterized protein LOC104088902 [Nicotiana tomentosiformis]XP_016514970.1 PREDICTED: uncharacterized protein LOC107831697 [Nicotiana tabacum]